MLLAALCRCGIDASTQVEVEGGCLAFADTDYAGGGARNYGAPKVALGDDGVGAGFQVVDDQRPIYFARPPARLRYSYA